MKKLIAATSAVVLGIVLFCCGAEAAQKPSVPSGAQWKLHNTATSMPVPRFSDSRSSPYPTNKWYTSTYIKNGYHNFSLRMSPGPLVINYNTGAGGTADGSGYIMGMPDIASLQNQVALSGNSYSLRVSGINAANAVIYSSTTFLQKESDWSFTGICQSSTNPSDRITTTFGKGFIFTYNHFSEGVNPQLYQKASNMRCYNSGGTQFTSAYTGDSMYIGVYNGGKWQYFGIYAPEGTQFIPTTYYLDIKFPASAVTEQQRYLSIALLCSYVDVVGEDAARVLEAKRIFNDYYPYAYNFVTDTKVSYGYDPYSSKLTTNFNFTFDVKRTGEGLISGQGVFALFPHQWKNTSLGTFFESQTFTTLRGKTKVLKGSSFSTQQNFFGMLPNLTYEVPQANKARLQTYINTDKNYNPGASPNTTSAYTNVNAPYRVDTYYSGKAVSKAANLIPILHQNGDIANRNLLIARLKSELETWYNGNSSTYKAFAYENTYGGIIGFPYNFGSNTFNDHNFHYGYFVYASAILALFDQEFAEKYKGIVDLIISDFANTDRNSQSFPFLRGFDVYEGHSWANGTGGADDRGNDQESSSESMNAWAGIYLWGIATKNQMWIDLGVYGYTTEYEAIKEYYLDISGDTYGGTAYAYKGIGMLYETSSQYATFFSAAPQAIKGIQVLPLTPSMLYLGYDSSYAAAYYNEMTATAANAEPNKWKDIWLRFQSLFDASSALQTMNTASLTTDDDGTSLTFSYHFVNFFNTLGKVSTTHYADNGSFCVMDKSGQKTFIAFNDSSSTYKAVNFKQLSGSLAGTMKVPPMTAASTRDFTEFKYDSLRSMYSGNGWHSLLLDKYSDSISLASASVSDSDRSCVVLPYAFTVSAPASSFGNITNYVYVSSISVPAGFTAGEIRLVLFDTETGLVKRNYLVQSVTVEPQPDSSVSLLIKAEISQTGTYVLAIPNYSALNGTIIDAGDGSAVSAAINVYDTVAGSTQAFNFTGSYEVELLKGVKYAITPQAEGYVFSPARFEITASENAVRNFQAYKAIKISGNIRNVKDSSAVSASFSVYDSVKKSTSVKTVDGYYEIDAIGGTEYVLTPKADGFIFVPDKMSVKSFIDEPGRDFTAYPLYGITGQVILGGAKPLDKINLNIYDTVSNSTSAAVTANGSYSGNLIYGRSYIITPVSQDYDFNPPSLMFNHVGGEISQANFYASITSGRFVAYPNPYKPSKHGNTGITFNGLKSGAEIKIYNIAGELVFETKTSVDGAYVWDSGNNSGNLVGSGVYIYYIKSEGRVRKGKIAIER